MTDPFAELSVEERAVVGRAADYGRAVKARNGKRSESAQFSLRIDRAELEALRALADARGLTFSELVRDALARYVGAGGLGAPVTLQVSGQAARFVRLRSGVATLPTNRTKPRPEPRPRKDVQEATTTA